MRGDSLCDLLWLMVGTWAPAGVREAQTLAEAWEGHAADVLYWLRPI